MNKVQRAIVSFLVIVCMCLIAVTTSGCTTGGMVQFGYLPVTSIDHHEMLDQKGRK